MIISAQIRAARALLRWTGKDAAAKSGVSLPTIKRLELMDGVPQSRSQTLLELQRAFEAAGVEFIGTPDDKPGVRLVKAQAVKAKSDVIPQKPIRK
jgi:transcriptional regulator with XRE-family HTH domain